MCIRDSPNHERSLCQHAGRVRCLGHGQRRAYLFLHLHQLDQCGGYDRAPLSDPPRRAPRHPGPSQKSKNSPTPPGPSSHRRLRAQTREPDRQRRTSMRFTPRNVFSCLAAALAVAAIVGCGGIPSAGNLFSSTTVTIYPGPHYVYVIQDLSLIHI